MSYTVGFLDQIPKIPGYTNEELLQKTVELAQLAEQTGYERFWVAEHHHSQDMLGSSPEVLIAYLLAKTSTIRIGSGGVMLRHYSPYKVAENFHVLATLAPGRVELGVGKGLGGLPLSTKALQYGQDNAKQNFDEKVILLQQLLQNQVDVKHELAGIVATPVPAQSPTFFLLGGSGSGAALAGNLHLPYSFAQFFNEDEENLKQAAKQYYERFPQGKFSISLIAIATDTEEEALRFREPKQIVKVQLQSGRIVITNNEENARDIGEKSGELYDIQVLQTTPLAGTKQYIKAELDRLHKQYGVDAFILHNPVPDFEVRKHSLELLSPQSLF